MPRKGIGTFHIMKITASCKYASRRGAHVAREGRLRLCEFTRNLAGNTVAISPPSLLLQLSVPAEQRRKYVWICYQINLNTIDACSAAMRSSLALLVEVSFQRHSGNHNAAAASGHHRPVKMMMEIIALPDASNQWLQAEDSR